MGSIDEAKKSQLLSPDGWKNYQKELTRLCFEFWEVNEKQVKLNNTLQSDLMREPATEIQLPVSLFADEHKKNPENTVGFESKVPLNSITVSEELKNNECVKINSHVFKSKLEDDSVMRELQSTVINNNIDWKNCGNCSKIVDVKGNERSKRKILKRFSFYKHSSSKQVKPNNQQQSLTFDRYSSCTLKDWRKYKKWMDTVGKIKTHNPDASILSGNIEENLEIINFDGKSDMFVYDSLDIEAMEMEQKVKELVKRINEKDKLLLTNIDDVNARTASKFGPSSNNFKHLFKNVFQGSHDDLDLRLMNDYTKYIDRKLNTWRALSDCLDDVRRRMSSRVNNTAAGARTAEDAVIKCERSETNKRHRGDRGPAQAMAGDRFDGIDIRSKFVETNESFGGTSRRKKYNFFKLLNKTKRSVDMRTTAAYRSSSNSSSSSKRTGRNGVREVRTKYNDDYCNNDGDYFYCDGCSASVIRIGGGGGGRNTLNRCGARPHAVGRKRARRIRKSFSDTDLPSVRPQRRISSLDHGDDGTAGRNETTAAAAVETLSIASDRNKEGRNSAHYFCGDGVQAMTGLWEDRQECFQTVVARLEYVGSTFREQCRLDGLKALCKVDVLAGFGQPAEAVDLFVRSALPLSDNPDLMIRKAEAAYDWKFFCHLSMWRHSYKE